MADVSWQGFRGLRWLPATLALAATGCGKVEVGGVYRDVDRPEVVYEFRPDATWMASIEMKVPVGLLPYGSGRKLEGVYRLRGSTLELTCQSVVERDPVSGEYRAVGSFDGGGEELLRGYDHSFTVEDGTLRVLGEAQPFGSGELTAARDESAE